MIGIKQWPAIVLTLGILAVVSVAVFENCRPTPTPIPPSEQKTLDSITITKPAYDSLRQQRTRVESVYVAQSRHEASGATQATHAADSLRAVAIAWQAAAVAQGDTSSRWYDVAKVERIENDSLRSANGGLLRALEHQTLARTAADARSVDDSSRLAAYRQFSDRLVADLKRADPPCRVLFVARCPSRRVAFVSGVIVASAGAYVLTHRSLVTGLVP